MIARTPVLLTLTALVLAACGLALGPPVGAPRAAAIPFACELVAQPRAGGGARIEARLTAREALRARYDLVIRGAGLSIDQGGDVALAAGETAVLGQASVSAAARTLDAHLGVTAGGRRVACPLRGF